jgi:hypothetical protein
LGITAPFQVPILDGADDVGFIGRPKLKLNLIPHVTVQVCQQQVESTATWLATLLILNHHVAQTQQAGVFDDALLYPPLV